MVELEAGARELAMKKSLGTQKNQPAKKSPALAGLKAAVALWRLNFFPVTERLIDFPPLAEVPTHTGFACTVL